MGKAKNSGPYLRGKYGVYYCWIEGRSRSLRTDRPKVAQANYQKMLKEWREAEELRARGRSPEPTVRDCIDLHLEHCRRLKPHSRAIRERDLGQFSAFAGIDQKPWAEATAEVAEAWVDSHPGWNDSTRRMKLVSLCCCFNYAVRRGKIPHSPIRGVHMPAAGRRRRSMSDADDAKVMAAADDVLGPVLRALRETGARPEEICSARVGDYRDGRIVLAEHKTDRHREDRVIHLTAALRGEVESLIAGREGGHIWLNSRGMPWTPDAILSRLKRMRERLGLGPGVFPYAMRGRFVTRAIERGVDLVTVSNLVGHRTLDMIKKHYFKPSDAHYRDALEKIADPTEGEPPTSPPRAT